MQYLALSVSTHALMVRGARVHTRVAGARMVRQMSPRRPTSLAMVQCAATRASTSHAAMSAGRDTACSQHVLAERIYKEWRPSSGSDWSKVGLITEFYRYTPIRVRSSRYSTGDAVAVFGQLRHHDDPVYDELDRGTHPPPPGI